MEPTNITTLELRQTRVHIMTRNTKSGKTFYEIETNTNLYKH